MFWPTSSRLLGEVISTRATVPGDVVPPSSPPPPQEATATTRPQVDTRLTRRVILRKRTIGTSGKKAATAVTQAKRFQIGDGRWGTTFRSGCWSAIRHTVSFVLLNERRIAQHRRRSRTDRQNSRGFS